MRPSTVHPTTVLKTENVRACLTFRSPIIPWKPTNSTPGKKNKTAICTTYYNKPTSPWSISQQYTSYGVCPRSLIRLFRRELIQLFPLPPHLLWQRTLLSYWYTVTNFMAWLCVSRHLTIEPRAPTTTSTRHTQKKKKNPSSNQKKKKTLLQERMFFLVCCIFYRTIQRPSQ